MAKRGTRYEAVPAVGIAARHWFGRLGSGAASGFALRRAHGSNFMSDAFAKQIRFRVMAPSHAFVARYDAEWLIEKNRQDSPDATRAAWN